MELRLGPHVFSIGDFIIYVLDAAGTAWEEGVIGIAEVTADPDVVARFAASHPGLPIAVAAPSSAIARTCTDAGAVLLVGDELADVASETGAGLVCSDPIRALAAGVRADGILVEAESAVRTRRLVTTGHAVLVTPGRTMPRTDPLQASRVRRGGRGDAPGRAAADPTAGTETNGAVGASTEMDSGTAVGSGTAVDSGAAMDSGGVVDSGTLAAVSVYAWIGARVFRVREHEVPAVRQALDMTASIMGHRPPAVSRRGLV